MGELSEPWHSKQVELLDRHLQLLHLYSQAKQNLENQKGKIILTFRYKLILFKFNFFVIFVFLIYFQLDLIHFLNDYSAYS